MHPSERRGLDRTELGTFLFTAERFDRDHAALAVLLGLNGLRVSEACATNIEDVQRVPSGLIPGGLFLTRKYTRRPDSQTAGCYTLESLQGSYGVVVNYDVNLAMGLQPEYLDGLGNLWRTGINNQPLTGSTT